MTDISSAPSQDESLNSFLPLSKARNASVVVGGGFNSGILATGTTEGAKYNYAPAPADIMQRVAAIESVCNEFNVPLPAAAIQFVTAHPAVSSFIAGTRTVEQLQHNLEWTSTSIPGAFWTTLVERKLLPENAPVPN